MTVRSFLRATSSRRRVIAAGAGAAVATAFPATADASAPAKGTNGRTGTWASVPTAVPVTDVGVVQDRTLRQIVRTSIAGDAVRIRLTNEFGDSPLVVGEVHVALRSGTGTDIVPSSDRVVTFGGATALTIPAGTPVVSDPVALRLAPASDLVISLYLPERTTITTVHGFAFQENVVAPGNVTGARAVTATATFWEWYFLSGVSVRTRNSDAAAIVTLGDSITDGAQTQNNADHRWPDLLAQRLRAAPGFPERGVLNLGISGNRLLYDPNPPAGSAAEGFAALFGQSALRRFDRDVVAQPGVRFAIVLLGINDIGHPGTDAVSSEAVTAADVIGGYRQLIARAHQAGINIFGGTLMPFKDDAFGFYSPANELVRQEVNRWIRTSREYDGVVDFDLATRDPADPLHLRPAYDSGDHLHPNDAGAAAMADAVPLGFFR